MRTDSITIDLFQPSFEVDHLSALIASLNALPIKEKVIRLNEIRMALHEASPFKGEPVDFVEWVPADDVQANDYNPNTVAPPEMELLRVSIMADGYTQPIVTMPEDGKRTVIDGFHRNRVGKECEDVRTRVNGFLPVVRIRSEQEDRSDRMASTIRHNRARGKHKVEAMTDIVVELKRRNWSDEKIAKNLGMDADEVLRLSQISGIAEVFKDQDFSDAWEVGADGTGELLSDVIPDFEADDKGRIFHTWDKWECYRAGFYKERPDGMTQQDGEEKYREFLSDLPRFELSLKAVTEQWNFSCEHYLTNDRINRIAWLGQASVAHALGIPSCCRGGYHLLTQEQQQAADGLALSYLNKWISSKGMGTVTFEQAGGRTEAELY
jgi:ParB-like chromosome segregation protein Spo0J